MRSLRPVRSPGAHQPRHNDAELARRGLDSAPMRSPPSCPTIPRQSHGLRSGPVPTCARHLPDLILHGGDLGGITGRALAKWSIAFAISDGRASSATPTKCCSDPESLTRFASGLPHQVRCSTRLRKWLRSAWSGDGRGSARVAARAAAHANSRAFRLGACQPRHCLAAAQWTALPIAIWSRRTGRSRVRSSCMGTYIVHTYGGECPVVGLWPTAAAWDFLDGDRQSVVPAAG